MSNDKESNERDEMRKNYDETLTDIDENMRIQNRQNKAKNMIYNHTNNKLMKDLRWKIQNYLKGLIAKKQEIMMIMLILILICRQM